MDQSMGTITRKLRRQWRPQIGRFSSRRYPLYRGPSLSALSARVSRLSRKLFASSELKHLDTNFNSSVINIPVSGVMLQLDQIAQGDTEVNRAGLRVSPKTLEIDANIVFADGYNKLRCIIFRWDDDSAPAAASLFQTGYTTYVQAPLSFALKPKYRVLWDYKTQVSQTVDEVAYIRKKFTFPATDQIVFGGSGATALMKGHVYMFICSDSTVITHPTCTGYARLTYIDL